MTPWTDGGVYGTSFGKVYINEAVEARDAEGNLAGWLLSVTSADGRDAPITICAGFLPDGTLKGIVYTELEETPGIGMKVAEPAFTGQFSGVTAGRLTLGGDVEAVSGATVSSRAVVNAVNAALDFFRAYVPAN